MTKTRITAVSRRRVLAGAAATTALHCVPGHRPRRRAGP